ncbi:hypothetical protein EAH87_14980 [Sphingomonas koreensis]|nr:hypothetical protein EAH87_14980 [Sphingomonas koreensis]
MTIELDRKWVRHEIVAWSVGLKWLTFVYHHSVVDPRSPLFLQERDVEYLKTVEQPLMDEWMNEFRNRHMTTHEAAIRHGLAPGGKNDLPVERILIDRLLKEVVQCKGIDVHGLAHGLGRNDDYNQLLANNQEYMGMDVGARHFQLKQLGLGLPVLSTWMPLGQAYYCGHALDLEIRLPETICAGVIDRRLGDLIATGISELDARVITQVITSPLCLMDHWSINTETRLCLEPDLVEIGS